LARDYSQPAYSETSRGIITQFGEPIIRETLISVAGRHPRSSVPNLASLLIKFRECYPEPLRLCLNNLLAQPNFPSDRLSPQDKEKFVKDVFEFEPQFLFPFFASPH